jgi:hypothetical protein
MQLPAPPSEISAAPQRTPLLLSTPNCKPGSSQRCSQSSRVYLASSCAARRSLTVPFPFGHHTAPGIDAPQSSNIPSLIGSSRSYSFTASRFLRRSLSSLAARNSATAIRVRCAADNSTAGARPENSGRADWMRVPDAVRAVR